MTVAKGLLGYRPGYTPRRAFASRAVATAQLIRVSVETVAFARRRRITDYTCRKPVGVTAQIGLWSFPLMLATWKMLQPDPRPLPQGGGSRSGGHLGQHRHGKPKTRLIGCRSLTPLRCHGTLRQEKQSTITGPAYSVGHNTVPVLPSRLLVTAGRSPRQHTERELTMRGVLLWL
jgi:hypothetical protein